MFIEDKGVILKDLEEKSYAIIIVQKCDEQLRLELARWLYSQNYKNYEFYKYS